MIERCSKYTLVHEDQSFYQRINTLENQRTTTLWLKFSQSCNTYIKIDNLKMEILECSTIKNNRRYETQIDECAKILLKQLMHLNGLNSEKKLQNIMKNQPFQQKSLNGKIVIHLKERLIGGGNIWSQNENELKQEKEKLMKQCLEEEDDEQKSCIYVKSCMEELKKMIDELTHLQSNSKTYCFQKFRDFNQVFFENKECHPLLLEFLELCADRLLFQQSKTQLIATEDQKVELIKQIDNYVILLQSFQKEEPLQNHIFYMKLIRQIFFISKSIQTNMQKLTKSTQSVFQIFVVLYKQDKDSLRQLIEKCKNLYGAFRQCDKIGGIIKYTEIILQNLDSQLGNNTLSTDTSFSIQDFSRQSTGDYSRQVSANNLVFNSQSFNQIVKAKNGSQDSYDIELQVRHQHIDLTSHFRVQYYALMQIDKLIQRMIDDPLYKVNESPLNYFHTFINDGQVGIINFSEKQYWFKKLENISFERNIMLRYISLSVLIRCYELFSKKQPQNQLLKVILEAIYFRYYFEPHQKIYILILKNKELLKAIQNMNSKEQENLIQQKAIQTSLIIESQDGYQNDNSRIKNESVGETFSLNQDSYEEDFLLMKSRVNFIKNIDIQGQLFIQSRIMHQNYIEQQFNRFKNNTNIYIEQYAFNFNSPQIPIKNVQQQLIKQYFSVKEIPIKKVIVVQGNSGQGKTELAKSIHQKLIELIKEQQDQIQIQPNQRNFQFKSCINQFGTNPFIYTPFILQLQNINLKDIDSFLDSLISEFQPLMNSSEYKVLIIDGLNKKNWKAISQVFQKLISEWRNFIFLITSTFDKAQQQQGVLQYNQFVIDFLNSLGISNYPNQIDGYQLIDFKGEQVIKYIENQCKNLKQIKDQNINNKSQLKSANQIAEQDSLVKFIIEKVSQLIPTNLPNNPLYLQQLYKIFNQFSTIEIEINSAGQIQQYYFQAQFCSTFKHWRQQNINSSYLKLFQRCYIHFFKLIAVYMKNNNQTFIHIDTVQNYILEQVTIYLEAICNQNGIKFSKNSYKNIDENLLDLYEQFISGMTRYFNSDIFDKIYSPNLNNQIKSSQIETICFKHDYYFQYFLELQ